MPGRNLTELGDEISRLTKKITQDLQARGQAIPSTHDTSTAGKEAALDGESALRLAEAARELEALALGPHQTLGLMGLSVEFIIRTKKPMRGARPDQTRPDQTR